MYMYIGGVVSYSIIQGMQFGIPLSSILLQIVSHIFQEEVYNIEKNWVRAGDEVNL